MANPLALAVMLAMNLPNPAQPPDFMQVPPQYKDQLGPYKPVLVFDDGTPVKSAQDWARRRQEILDSWHKTLGPWPALLDKPALQEISTEHVENFTRKKVRIQVASDEHKDAYLLIPDGQPPFPAVLVVWYNPEDSAGLDPNHRTVAFGYDLAKRGFVTLCIGADARNPRPDVAERIQPASYLAYCAANACNLLGNLPEVDPNRIGVVGHSFGGKWALFASCLYDKFAAAAWSDPGIVWNEQDSNANWWDLWYLGYEKGAARKPGRPTPDNPATGAYKTLRDAGRDLHELICLMPPRPLLLSGGQQDPPDHWLALNHAVAVAKLLGRERIIGMTHRPAHSPTPQSNEQIYRFFEFFLKNQP